jgi:hypothetical protein
MRATEKVGSRTMTSANCRPLQDTNLSLFSTETLNRKRSTSTEYIVLYTIFEYILQGWWLFHLMIETITLKDSKREAHCCLLNTDKLNICSWLDKLWQSPSQAVPGNWSNFLTFGFFFFVQAKPRPRISVGYPSEYPSGPVIGWVLGAIR